MSWTSVLWVTAAYAAIGYGVYWLVRKATHDHWRDGDDDY